MTKSTKLIFIISFFACISLASPVMSGDCLDSPEYMLNDLKEKTGTTTEADKDTIFYNIACLRDKVNYLHMGYEHFASPTAIKTIQRENKSTKSMACEILPDFLDHQDQDIRCNAAFTLAFYGWSKSYDYIASCNEQETNTEKAILYAILGDKRAVPWIMEQYKIIERKYKTKPIFSYPDKMTYLNALYHLADPASLPFLESVIENPKPEKIKARAIKVKKRIKQINEN